MGYGDALSSKDDLKGRDGIDLLARMIYSEAGNQTEEGKRGCAYVAKNRKDRNEKPFGYDTWEGVILKANQFSGMSTSAALKPDISSNGWKDSLDIAQNLSGKVNPIGGCLWFNANTTYNNHSIIENGKEFYWFGSDVDKKKEVTEKYVIGGHTFFKIAGY